MGGASWSTITPRPRGSFILTGESHLLNDLVRSHLARRRCQKHKRWTYRIFFYRILCHRYSASQNPLQYCTPTHTDSLVFLLGLCSSLTTKILPKCLQMFRFHQLTFQFEQRNNFLHLRRDADDNDEENEEWNIIWHDRTTRTTQKTVCTFTLIWHKLPNLTHVLSAVNAKWEEFVAVKRHGHQGAVRMFWQLFWGDLLPAIHIHCRSSYS